MARLYKPNHPNSNSQGYIEDYRLRAAEALGKPLPKRAMVHRVNLTGELVICQNQAYNMLLHQRERALKACGNANYRKCPYCKQYDDPENMTLGQNNYGVNEAFHHQECFREYHRSWRE